MDTKIIVGNGDIASILSLREGALFFGSGVSNSNCNDDYEFQREHDLLYSYRNFKLCCIYFSSIAIYDQCSSPYILHKISMENSVKDYFDNYCIIRIGNIDWGKNPNTFLNYLRNKIKNNEPHIIKDEFKYMISKDQLVMVANSVPLIGRNEICIFGYKSKVIDLL